MKAGVWNGPCGVENAPARAAPLRPSSAKRNGCEGAGLMAVAKASAKPEHLRVLYRALADAVRVLHFAFVAFAVVGGVLVLRRPRVAFAHLPAVAWSAWVELAGWPCPLTPLENQLRALGGVQPYPESFVEHYLLPVLYPAALTREVQLVLGALVLAINAAVYAAVVQRWRRTAVH